MSERTVVARSAAVSGVVCFGRVVPGAELVDAPGAGTGAVCTGAACLSTGSGPVKTAIEQQLAGGDGQWQVIGTGCLGLCHAGPLTRVTQPGQPDLLVTHATPDIATALTGALVAGHAPQVDETHRADPGGPFFVHQTRIVTENAGRIDSEKIEDYIAADGYAALQRVLAEMKPDEVVREVMTSQLRGRGGAGYPTGLKWSTVAKAKGAGKFVICNADEGDPGAFMDRSVLEGDPHRVIEGMAIAAFAVGAEQGYIYVRGEYPLAIARLKTAIKQAERLMRVALCLTNTRHRHAQAIGSHARPASVDETYAASFHSRLTFIISAIKPSPLTSNVMSGMTV